MTSTPSTDQAGSRTTPTTLVTPTKSRHPLLRFVAVLLAMLGIGLMVPAISAQADITYSGGTVRSGAVCDRYQHTMTMQGSIVLADRFTNGAYLASRYAYYTVNSALARTSPVYMTGWQYSNGVPSVSHVGDLTIGGGPNGLRSQLPAYKINTWGQFRVMVQVGVWNGSYYEYSNWDTATGYDNYGQFGIYSYNNRCLASLT